jgi:hypothetical protein
MKGFSRRAEDWRVLRGPVMIGADGAVPCAKAATGDVVLNTLVGCSLRLPRFL